MTGHTRSGFHYIYLADVRLDDGAVYKNVYLYDEEYYDAALCGQRCFVYAKTFLKSYAGILDYNDNFYSEERKNG